MRSVARFLERLEPEVLRLQRRLVGGTWRPSPPTTFRITDPKPREISAAPFGDRVVHHALIGPLEDDLDAALCPETFACRLGKGTHRALDHAQSELRRHSHFLKLDIARCFASIGHAIVLDTLERTLSLSPCTTDLVRRLLAGSGPRALPPVGLPIGNLTSQWFANLVLGRIDHFVLEELGVPGVPHVPGVLGVHGYVRYMDDFVLFGDCKADLRMALEAVRGFVTRVLGLELKERATLLAPASQGLPFLGWRLYRGMRRMRPENMRRLRGRLRRRRWELRQGRISPETYLAALGSVLAQERQAGGSGLSPRTLSDLCPSDSE